MDKRIVINTGPLIALMRMEALEVAESMITRRFLNALDDELAS